MSEHIKYLDNRTQVDLSESREVWNNGRHGDHRVELWADERNEHVWLETNGDPVYDEESLREALSMEGMDTDTVDLAIVGDL